MRERNCNRLFHCMALVAASVLCACQPSDSDSPDAADPSDASARPDATPGSWYTPGVGTTWQWQLTGTINGTYNVDVYDIDLFDSSMATIQNLQGAGRRVICYFSAGSSEDWRPDFARFTTADQGSMVDNWAGELWLDVRSANVMAIMIDRLILARDKGCDGVEPDNVDGYANSTGFSLTAADQEAFNIRLANEAHALGLSIGLKNDLDQIGALVGHFDFAVNEECHAYNECSLLAPFVNAGKPVFSAEYAATMSAATMLGNSVCPAANTANLRTLVLHLDLDDSIRVSCD